MKIFIPLLILINFSLLASFISRQVVTRVHVVAMSQSGMRKGKLTINDRTLKIKQGQFSEFDVTGDSVVCHLNVQIPLFINGLPPVAFKGGNDLYLWVYLKYAKPLSTLKTFYIVDTICQACYNNLKEKANKLVNPE